MDQVIGTTDQWIIAHRGVAGRFPENTRAAFEAAVTSSADAIECDLQLTSDGHIVLCHNSDLGKYGHSNVHITTSTLQELQKPDIGSWFSEEFCLERLMSLSELLNEFGHRIPLLLELKTQDLTAEQTDRLTHLTLIELEKANLPTSPCLLCFDRKVLRNIHLQNAELKLIWNTHEPHRITPADIDRQPWLHGIDGRIDHISADTIGLIHSKQRTTYTFTCNTEEEVLKASALRVKGIITDDPDRTRDILKSNQRGNNESGRQQTAARTV